MRASQGGRPRLIWKLEFPYTLNGTALAAPRVIAAILENNWNERDYSVTIPEVLRPFMGDLDKIQGQKMHGTGNY